MFSWTSSSFSTQSFVWTTDGLIKLVAQLHCPAPRIQRKLFAQFWHRCCVWLWKHML